MVTFDDLLVIIVPSMIAIVGSLTILLIGRHMNVFDKTQQKSTFATFNIGNLSEDVKEMKRMHDEQKAYSDRKWEGMTQLLEKKDEVMRAEFRRAWEKLDTLASSMRLFEYRLDRLERESANALAGAGTRGRTGGGSGRPGSPENGTALM